jgi:hypothetical protein
MQVIETPLATCQVRAWSGTLGLLRCGATCCRRTLSLARRRSGLRSHDQWGFGHRRGLGEWHYPHGDRQHNDGDYGDLTVTTAAGYATDPEYIGTPPYGGVCGIHSPPDIYVYVDSGVAFNSGNGIPAIAGLPSILAAASTAGIAAGVAAGATGLINLDYPTIHGADHNADGSLRLWIPWTGSTTRLSSREATI